ncbi:MAG: hypothetical protein H0W40_05930 [Methylibium sp.]|uniref:hypothetical protein n=1 Tax=Methylibium sp. TaxID=2067992 RepID=UPI0017DA47BD|nr:hypothetical protein [Methylibium sp.]MBA3596902.1 hypothetical protein [Methylibium sp.]
MNASRTTTSLAVLIAAFALAGCDQRDDAAVVTPSPGSTASAPGMTGETGSMAPGGTAIITPPPMGGASGMDTTTPPAMAPGARPPASRP